MKWWSPSLRGLICRASEAGRESVMKRRLLEWSRGVAIWSVSLGLYVWLGGESLRLVWWASTILLLGGALTSLLGPTRITISHTSSPSCIQAGDSAQMTVQVTYRSLLPVPWLIITDRIGIREYRKLLFPAMKRRLEYTYRLNQVPAESGLRSIARWNGAICSAGSEQAGACKAILAA